MPMCTPPSETSSNCGDLSCYPCLPRCHRSEITYCCDRKPSHTSRRFCKDVCDDVPKVHCRQRSPCARPASPVCYHPPPRWRCCSPARPVYCSRTHSPECCSPALHRSYYSGNSRDCCEPIPDYRHYCYDNKYNYHYNQRSLCCQPPEPVRTRYVMPCYRYEDGRIDRYVPTIHGRLPKSVFSRNGIQDHMYGYRGAIHFLCASERHREPCVYNVVTPLVRKLPVTAFKRNGMQDQEHSKLLGTANFLQRCPRDVAIEYDVCKREVYVSDPLKVPKVPKKKERPLGSKLLRKRPVEENQPTVLMRRACEVAVGVRPRHKPFVEASYRASDNHEVRHFHSEDQKGNLCYHFEKKNTGGECAHNDCVDCVRAIIANPADHCCVYY